MATEELAAALSRSLQEAQLVPGAASSLIPADFKPSTKLHVSFNGRNVEFGDLFRANECKIAPSIAFPLIAAGFPTASYMLMLIDPDAPTPEDPKFAFWRHWVVPGLQPLKGMVSVAETKPALTEYLGPGPKDDSTPHRYLFLLFREPEGLDLTKDDVGGEEFVQRRSFDAKSFIEKHNLKLVAVNWMKGAGDGWKE